MELSDKGFELCYKKRNEEGDHHSLNHSYVLKAVLGSLRVISLSQFKGYPQYDPIKQGLSSPI